MSSEACGAALALSLDTDDTAADNCNNESYRHGYPIKLCAANEIKYT
jgi:hypothetical protein